MLDLNALSCNEAQRLAISHNTGPALVIAGPGSGKTFVISHRVKYLIENLGISPGNILVITFTKAAALQMQQRINKLLLNTTKEVSFGTFHSVFFNILCHAGLYTKGSICSGQDKYLIVKEAIERLDIDTSDIEELITNVLNDISRYKSMLHTSDKFVPRSTSHDTFFQIYNWYNRCLMERGALDFDDMLIKAYELLNNNRGYREKWQNKYRYILIDEFQDIDRLQYDTIKLLLGKDKNIFAVGDDDQSIYSFRGGIPDIMLGFEDDYAGAKKILLNINYRSNEEIINKAIKLIEHNEKRFKKEILSDKGEGGLVRLINFPDRNKETDYIIDILKNKAIEKSAGILCRTNSEADYIVERLVNANIAFEIKDRSQAITDHFITKDIICYLRLAIGDNTRANFYKIMNRPLRYISRASVPGECVDFNEIIKFYRAKGYGVERCIKLKEDINFLKKQKPYGAIIYILNVIGYKEFIRESAKKNKVATDSYLEIVNELLERSKDYTEIKEFINSLDNSNTPQVIENKFDNKIFIDTLHGSKGLEYDIVFIVNIVEGMIPYKKAVFPEEIEEERRLFYVGITRARQELYLCSVDSLRQRDVKKSGFLEEIN